MGPFTAWSAPSVDSFGDPQISWIVESAGKRIFHGSWWRIAHQFGPLHLTFLPINGAIVDFSLLQPASPLEAIVTPEQAAGAANMLRAQCVMPIHYGSLYKLPIYIETPHPNERLGKNLAELGIQMRIQEPGEWFVLK